MHRPIDIGNLCFAPGHRTCFEHFTTRIHYGNRIGIIGDNGAGKSSLLRIIAGLLEPTRGSVHLSPDVVIGYVPQIISDTSHSHIETMSGGERLNKALSAALALNPNILLLDEPTNHLDRTNRSKLLKFLRSWHGTLIIVSHDVTLLNTVVDTLWYVHDGSITMHTGTYDDFRVEQEHREIEREKKVDLLRREQRNAREKLELQRKREARGRRAGKQEEDRVRRGALADKASSSSGKMRSKIGEKIEHIARELAQSRESETITPHFDLAGVRVSGEVLSIREGAVGYAPSTRQQKFILRNISLHLSFGNRIALQGDNGSGKSTLLRAIAGDPRILREGEWRILSHEKVGYLDQHYGILHDADTVFDTIKRVQSSWTDGQIRKHLNDFLFRKNEEVNAKIATLSGGERARLCLALIAARPPALLLLDEITNNLDLRTRDQVIAVLRAYPGALIIISHDDDFLEQIGIAERYVVTQETLILETTR